MLLRVGVDVRSLAVGEEIRGFARYTHGLLHAISRRCDVEIVAFSDREVADLPDDVVVHRFDGGREIFSEQVRWPALVHSQNVDVLLGPANRGLPMITSCPTVLTLHDAVEWSPQFVDPLKGRDRVRFAYSTIASLWNATRVLTVSEHSAREIHRVLGIPTSRLRPVLEAADERFCEHADTTDAAFSPQLADVDRNSVLYVGGFDAKKSVDVLIAGFGIAARELPTIQLVLAGAKPPVDAVRTAAVRAGVEDRVRCLGYVDDALLPSLYRRSGCYASAAAAEGFGLPAMEAMASGLPVIVADSGAAPEVVGVAGRLFESGNAMALGRRIVEVMNNDQSRSEAARLCMRRAAEFSWNRTADETLAVLREAANTRGLRRVRDLVEVVPHTLRWVA